MKRILDRNVAELVTLTALSTTGVAFDCTEADDRTVYIATAEGTTTITVVAGGPQGVADYTIDLKAGTNVFTLDSMLFKHEHGTNKGKVVIKGATTIKVGVIALP